MPAAHVFLLCDAFGRRLEPLGYKSASYSLSANAPGSLSLALAVGTGADIQAGQIVEVWRCPGYGVGLAPVDEFIVTASKATIAASGTSFYTLECSDTLWLLAGYANRYASTVWAGAADDYMRAVFRGNFMADGPGDGSSSPAARRRSLIFSLPIACEPDMRLGPRVKVTSPAGQVLGAMQALAKKAMVPDGYPGIPGRPLFFDIYAHQRNPLGFTFAVFADQRGRDLRGSGVTLSVGRELLKTEIEESYAGEVNAVFWTSGGVKRVMVDAQRSGRGPLARREASVGTTMDAQSALREGMPPYSLRASLVDTANCVLGRDYWWGDAVNVAVGGLVLPMRLDSVSIGLDAAGNEDRSARFNLMR